MKIQSVNDEAFKAYGRVVDGYDCKEMLEKLEELTDMPGDSVIYVPSVPELEATPAYDDFSNNCFGGMPIEIGYCNGTNTKLNCFEYHHDNEINVAANDAILLRQRLFSVRSAQPLIYILLLCIMHHAALRMAKASGLQLFFQKGQMKKLQR